MSTFRVRDLSVFFISFDEPWAAEFFADLRRKAPQAGHVHGVVGHDNAIKECARRSRTDRFVTVDADNLIRPELLDVTLDDTDRPDTVFSFRGRNVLNGLEYGNGGPMCWPRSTALSMRTHAAAEDESAAVDFCWSTPTYVVDAVGSDVHVTQTPYHAFRAGYREAVKMTLVHGAKPSSLAAVRAQIAPSNWSRLMMWTSVGADVPNGDWAVFGARQGLYDIWVSRLPITVINDYDWFDGYWRRLDGVDPAAHGAMLATDLNDRFDLGIVDLSPETSRWVKQAYLNPTWSGLITPARPSPAASLANAA